jgi:hypothetical protein
MTPPLFSTMTWPVASAFRRKVEGAWRRSAKLVRDWRKRAQRGSKHARESLKHTRAQVRHGRDDVRDGLQHAYTGAVRTTRYWDRVQRRALGAAALEIGVRRELRRAAAGDAPIIVGPWLSEVGYEALYWVPFVRWFAEHYRVAPERLVVVSRGGVASWYADVAAHYVELLDLFPPAEFAARNEERRSSGDQKQLGAAAFDTAIVDRVRTVIGAPGARVCHPSTMFRLLRHFWLGTESLQQVLDHTRYARVAVPAAVVPALPERYVAVKFYTGRALPDRPANRAALRALVERVSRDTAVVALSTGLALDEHEDYLFRDIPGLITLDGALTPQNNLAVQTAVIGRAERFIGTCGSVAWLAPMLGTETLAVYADEHFLTPHLYAAAQVYPAMNAAPFTTLNLRAMDSLT